MLFGCRHRLDAVQATIEPVRVHYDVTTLDNLGGVRVRVCVDGHAVRDLVPIRKSTASALRRSEVAGDVLDVDEGRIRLLRGKRNPCVEYEARFRSSWFDVRVENAVVVSQAQWLWRPHPYPAELEATIRFVLSDNEDVAVPWPQVDGVYRLDETALFTDGYAVFGEFDRIRLDHLGVRLEVARLAPVPAEEEVVRWLSRALGSAASIGSFPRDEILFVVAPVDLARDDVVFGMLRRGGGASILLVPSVNATREGLDADWVAVHELSHLWLPTFHPRDRWISEGIATYLQEVLRARCVQQSGNRSWERLLAGFERGRRSGTGRALAVEARDMNQTGAYHRVYWAGASFALEADVAIRRTSKAKRTLLDAIREAQPRWGTSARPVDARQFISALDPGEESLIDLASTYARRTGFPPLPFEDHELDRWLREIMAPAPEGCRFSEALVR